MTPSDFVPSSRLILFSQDWRLAQTRQWVLEQAGLHIETVHSLPELYDAVTRREVTVFLLCNSLSAALRMEAATHIRTHWPNARILIFVPSYPLPELPADDFIFAMEGPGHLIDKVRRLIPAAQL